MSPEHVPARRRFSWALAFTLIVLLVLFALGFFFWRVETWPLRNARAGTAELERLGREARDAFIQLAQLQPRVTINNRVYFERTDGIAELAMLTRQTQVEHEFLHTWAGSTKRVKLHGTFAVKVGFDLRDNLAVDVRDDEIVVQVPHAKILSLEMQKAEVLEFQNGLWNRITAQDVQNEIGALPTLAREKAEQSELLVEAETALRQQLEERIRTERPVRLVFTPATAVKP